MDRNSATDNSELETVGRQVVESKVEVVVVGSSAAAAVDNFAADIDVAAGIVVAEDRIVVAEDRIVAADSKTAVAPAAATIGVGCMLTSSDRRSSEHYPESASRHTLPQRTMESDIVATEPAKRLGCSCWAATKRRQSCWD